MMEDLVDENELEKVKNKTESIIAFEDMSIMSRASSLANYELLGDANLMNTELKRYQEVTVEDIRNYSRIIIDGNNSNTLYYYSKN
jgi:predicted Zn-dependent peptidase